MGRSVYFKHVDDDNKFKDINPTCIWGFINGVGYRHWRYTMKRMLPYKGNHVKGHTIPSYDFEEHQQLLNEEESQKAVRLNDSHVDQSIKKVGSTKKRSIKARLKKLLVHHSNKERNGKHQRKKCVPPPGYRLQRTYSIHHLQEQRDHDPAGKRNWKHPIYFIPGKKEVGNGTEESGERYTKLNDKVDSSNGTNSNEFANVLEMLQVDKKLFLEILQNANDGKANAKLIKSGSFPSANHSHKRSLKPSKLQDKQSVLKWEKFPDVTSSAENTEGPFKLGRALGLILEHTTGSEVVSNEYYRTTGGKDTDEIKVDRDGGESSRKSSEIEEYMLRKNAFAHRRSISLTESLDKYVELFENNFGKEGKLLPSSRSLKLRNEDEIKAYKNIPPSLFSRIRSLSSLDYLYSSFQYEESNIADTSTEEIVSCTNEDSKGDVNAISFSENIQEVIQLDDIHDTAGFSAETCTEPTVSERETDKVQQSCMDFASESSLEDRAAALDDFQSFEGMENRCDNIDQELSFNHDTVVDQNILEMSKSVTEDDDAELEYIKHILEFSGFTREGLDWEWQSSDQPLKASLFDEACRPNDLERFIEDLGSFYYYQLLFDLLNEELVNLLSRSSTYYPKKLSYSCRIRAFPIGNHMVEEISSDIGELLNFKPGEKPSIDSIIDFDLKKDESWMNLQYESESVALEVDHMIFEDLLNELVC